MELFGKNKDINADLKDLVLSSECVAFIGSGLSAGIYWPWFHLINNIYVKCHLKPFLTENSTAEQLIDAAQRVKQLKKRIYNSVICRHFGRQVKETSRYYEALLSAPFKCYLTTNFDPLISLQIPTAKIPIDPKIYCYPIHLDRDKMVTRSVQYLHGYVKEGESKIIDNQIVLSKDDFDTAYKDGSLLKSLLLLTLAHENILFIGCELKEPSLKRIFDLYKEQQELLRRYLEEKTGKYTKPCSCYILLKRRLIYINRKFDKKETRAYKDGIEKDYKHMGIDVIWFDEYEDLQHALNILADITPPKIYIQGKEE